MRHPRIYRIPSSTSTCPTADYLTHRLIPVTSAVQPKNIAVSHRATPRERSPRVPLVFVYVSHVCFIASRFLPNRNSRRCTTLRGVYFWSTHLLEVCDELASGSHRRYVTMFICKSDNSTCDYYCLGPKLAFRHWNAFSCRIAGCERGACRCSSTWWLGVWFSRNEKYVLLLLRHQKEEATQECRRGGESRALLLLFVCVLCDKTAYLYLEFTLQRKREKSKRPFYKPLLN